MAFNGLIPSTRDVSSLISSMYNGVKDFLRSIGRGATSLLRSIREFIREQFNIATQLLIIGWYLIDGPFDYFEHKSHESIDKINGYLKLKNILTIAICLVPILIGMLLAVLVKFIAFPYIRSAYDLVMNIGEQALEREPTHSPKKTSDYVFRVLAFLPWAALGIAGFAIVGLGRSLLGVIRNFSSAASDWGSGKPGENDWLSRKALARLPGAAVGAIYFAFNFLFTQIYNFFSMLAKTAGVFVLSIGKGMKAAYKLDYKVHEELKHDPEKLNIVSFTVAKGLGFTIGVPFGLVTYVVFNFITVIKNVLRAVIETLFIPVVGLFFGLKAGFNYQFDRDLAPKKTGEELMPSPLFTGLSQFGFSIGVIFGTFFGFLASTMFGFYAGNVHMFFAALPKQKKNEDEQGGEPSQHDGSNKMLRDNEGFSHNLSLFWDKVHKPQARIPGILIGLITGVGVAAAVLVARVIVHAVRIVLDVLNIAFRSTVSGAESGFNYKYSLTDTKPTMENVSVLPEPVFKAVKYPVFYLIGIPLGTVLGGIGSTLRGIATGFGYMLSAGISAQARKKYLIRDEKHSLRNDTEYFLSNESNVPARIPGITIGLMVGIPFVVVELVVRGILNSFGILAEITKTILQSFGQGFKEGYRYRYTLTNEPAQSEKTVLHPYVFGFAKGLGFYPALLLGTSVGFVGSTLLGLVMGAEHMINASLPQSWRPQPKVEPQPPRLSEEAPSLNAQEIENAVPQDAAPQPGFFKNFTAFLTDKETTWARSPGILVGLFIGSAIASVILATRAVIHAIKIIWASISTLFYSMIEGAKAGFNYRFTRPVDPSLNDYPVMNHYAFDVIKTIGLTPGYMVGTVAGLIGSTLIGFTSGVMHMFQQAWVYEPFKKPTKQSDDTVNSASLIPPFKPTKPQTVGAAFGLVIGAFVGMFVLAGRLMYHIIRQVLIAIRELLSGVKRGFMQSIRFAMEFPRPKKPVDRMIELQQKPAPETNQEAVQAPDAPAPMKHSLFNQVGAALGMLLASPFSLLIAAFRLIEQGIYLVARVLRKIVNESISGAPVAYKQINNVFSDTVQVGQLPPDFNEAPVVDHPLSLWGLPGILAGVITGIVIAIPLNIIKQSYVGFKSSFASYANLATGRFLFKGFDGYKRTPVQKFIGLPGSFVGTALGGSMVVATKGFKYGLLIPVAIFLSTCSIITIAVVRDFLWRTVLRQKPGRNDDDLLTVKSQIKKYKESGVEFPLPSNVTELDKQKASICYIQLFDALTATGNLPENKTIDRKPVYTSNPVGWGTYFCRAARFNKDSQTERIIKSVIEKHSDFLSDRQNVFNIDFFETDYYKTVISTIQKEERELVTADACFAASQHELDVLDTFVADVLIVVKDFILSDSDRSKPIYVQFREPTAHDYLHPNDFRLPPPAYDEEPAAVERSGMNYVRFAK